MTKVMMTLGKFRFSLGTAAYKSLRRSVEYRWEAQARAGRIPARQFVGPGNETIELDGVIYPQQQIGGGEAGAQKRVGLGQMDRLRAEAGRGEPLPLTDGMGNHWGKWCIERVEETRSAFFPDGAPRKIEFRLSLSRYGEDQGQG